MSQQLVFPVGLLAPSDFTWSIDGAAIEGGQPIAGPPQTGEISGGGYWMCEHQVGILRTHAQVGTYRAILSQIFHGAKTIVVPVIDALKPFPAGVGGIDTDPFGDGSTFDDGSEFSGDPIEASLAAAGYMPALPACRLDAAQPGADHPERRLAAAGRRILLGDRPFRRQAAAPDPFGAGRRRRRLHGRIQPAVPRGHGGRRAGRLQQDGPAAP